MIQGALFAGNTAVEGEVCEEEYETNRNVITLKVNLGAK